MMDSPSAEQEAREDDLLAEQLGVSETAVSLMRDSDVIDMHIDTFIPMRLFGYDPARRHGRGLLRGRHFGHLDLPRIQEAGLTGAMWSITTNPFRTAEGRWRHLEENIAKLRAFVKRTPGLCEVSNLAEYRAVRDAGEHAVMMAVQGGNALEAGVPDRRELDPALVRVTLVHLTSSGIGGTSSPLGIRKHLSEAGLGLVEMLDEARVFVDLAHIHPEGFWEAYVVHDHSLPLLVTHTGVQGVRRHWRNLDDAQLRAVADTGGVVGIMFHTGFLRRKGGPRDAEMVVEHILHALKVAGEDAVGIGSDYDGFIVPPKDLRSGVGYARIVQGLLDRGVSEDGVKRVLGGNFLRALGELRPQGP